MSGGNDRGASEQAHEADYFDRERALVDPLKPAPDVSWPQDTPPLRTELFGPDGMGSPSEVDFALRENADRAHNKLYGFPSDDVRSALRNIVDAWDAFEGMQLQLDEGLEQAIKAGSAALRSAQVSAPAHPFIEVPLTFLYKNHRGEVALRNVFPVSVRFGTTEWHPEAQWLLKAFDCEKQAEREFAMRDISAPAVGVTREVIAQIVRLTLASRLIQNIAGNAEGGPVKEREIASVITDVTAAYGSPAPDATVSEPVAWRTFDTTGTVLTRSCNVLTITCENGETANRVAGQLRAAAPRPARDAEIEGLSRDAIAIEVMNVRRRIHGLDDLDLKTLRRIKLDAGINEASAAIEAAIRSLTGAKP